MDNRQHPYLKTAHNKKSFRNIKLRFYVKYEKFLIVETKSKKYFT